MFNAKYTFGEQMARDHYHANIIQTQLTRSLTTKFADVCEEIDLAFRDQIPKPDKEGGELIFCSMLTHMTLMRMSCHLDWIAVPALRLMQRVVCRASNRIFVGVPLCKSF